MSNLNEKLEEDGIHGLTDSQVQERISQGKVNQITNRSSKSIPQIIASNVLTFFNLIFAIITGLLIAVGSIKSLTFLPVVIANMLIGIVQQIRAKQVLDKLSLLDVTEYKVLRDGQEQRISSDQLVQDDIIVLESGQQVPADGVVVAGEVSANESLLTGEPDEIVKTTGSLLRSGSFIVSGKAYGRLQKVGSESYVAQLSKKAKEVQDKPAEMVRDIERIIRIAGILIIPVGLGLLYQGIFVNGETIRDAVVSSVGAVIGMIPEGMYLLATMSLAMSAARLAQKQVLLHDMKSIETLARVDVLCVDKTGTITTGSMTVTEVLGPDTLTVKEQSSASAQLLRQYAATIPDSNSTMQAIRQWCGDANTLPFIDMKPFSSRTKYSEIRTTQHTWRLGAPEYLLSSAMQQRSTPQEGSPVIQPGTSAIQTDASTTQDGYYTQAGASTVQQSPCDTRTGTYATQQYVTVQSVPSSVQQNSATQAGIHNGTSEQAQDLQALLRAHMEKGERVLAFTQDDELLLLICLQNEIRDTAKDTFRYFEERGVDVKVISGDNPVTVSRVAMQAGIRNADRYVDATALTSPALIDAAVARYTVFGRVKPEQKKDIVKALHKREKKVAMTGDGVNDILAMKEADCSIAMGEGSDAARQAAQVVLMDSDFSRMKDIVGEGRRDVNNITRSATLFLYKNIFSLLLAVFSLLNNFTYPLDPNQVSLISFFNIGAPAFLLTLEDNQQRQENGFLKNTLLRAMPAALTSFFTIAVLVLFGQLFHLPSDEISTASTYLLSLVGFMILARITKPLNWYHVCVFILCAIGVLLACTTGFRQIFSLSLISPEAAALCGVFAVAEFTVMNWMTRLFELLPRIPRIHLRRRQR